MADCARTVHYSSALDAVSAFSSLACNTPRGRLYLNAQIICMHKSLHVDLCSCCLSHTAQATRVVLFLRVSTTDCHDLVSGGATMHESRVWRFGSGEFTHPALTVFRVSVLCHRLHSTSVSIDCTVVVNTPRDVVVPAIKQAGMAKNSVVISN